MTKILPNPFLFSLALTLLLPAACKVDPPAVAECEATGDGGTGCSDQPIDPEPPECASPEFEGMHPPAISYECEGQAGGALVYNQLAIEINNELKGGPGSIPAAPDENEDPEWTPFPSQDDTVGACCHGMLDPGSLENACARDCGRRACNTVLERLREKAGQGDPSDGKCNALVLADAIGNCQERILKSIQSWIVQLEERYDECVDAAIANSDPDLPYWEHLFPFADSRIVEFDDWGCSTNAIGCLYDAELRPFCEITSVIAQPMSSCEQAGNDKDPNAGGALDDTGGDDGADDGDPPFGDVGASLFCSPQTECSMYAEFYQAVFGNFHVFYDEGVLLTPVVTPAQGFQLSGLDNGEYSKELLDVMDIRNGDVITHANGNRLDSPEGVLDAVDSIATQSSWTVRVRRWTGSSWAILDYSIEIIPLFGAPLHTDGRASGQLRSELPVGDAASAPSSCACRATGQPLAPLASLMFLVGFGARRSRMQSSPPRGHGRPS